MPARGDKSYEMNVKIVSYLRKLGGIRRGPFCFNGRVDRSRNRILCNEISMDEFNFSCNSAFDGLSAPPRGLNTVRG